MIGKRIAYYRIRLGLTQEQLAHQIGVKRASLSHYECNRQEPDITTIVKLADRFGVTIDGLVRGMCED